MSTHEPLQDILKEVEEHSQRLTQSFDQVMVETRSSVKEITSRSVDLMASMNQTASGCNRSVGAAVELSTNFITECQKLTHSLVAVKKLQKEINSTKSRVDVLEKLLDKL